jgi:hypothetical protein
MEEANISVSFFMADLLSDSTFQNDRKGKIGLSEVLFSCSYAWVSKARIPYIQHNCHLHNFMI